MSESIWPECALRYLEGGGLEDAAVLVVGPAPADGPRAARFSEGSDPATARAEGAASFVLLEPEPGAGTTPEQLRSLSMLASIELGVVRRGDSAQSFVDLLRAAEQARLVLVGIEPLAGEVPSDLLRFVRDRGLPYSGERLNLARAPAKTVYEHAVRYVVASEAAREGRVLDLGCGEGIGTVLLAETATEVVAIDVDLEAIEVARSTRSRENISYLRGSLERLSGEIGSFDLIVCLEVIEHLSADEQRATVDLMARHLRPDGLVIVSTPNPSTDPDNEFHTAPIGAPELDAVLASHFPHRRMLGSRMALGASVAPLEGARSEGARLCYVRSSSSRHLLERCEAPEAAFFLALASRHPLPESSAVWVVDPGERLMAEVGSMRAKAERIRSDEGSRLRGEIQRTAEARASLKEQHARLEARHRELEGDRARVESRNRGLEVERARLVEDARRLRVESARLRGQLVGLYRKVLEDHGRVPRTSGRVLRGLDAIRRALMAIPPHPLPDPPARRSNDPVELACWLSHREHLEERMAEMAMAVDRIVAMRLFRALWSLRARYLRLRGRAAAAAGPRHTGSLVTGVAPSSSADLQGAVDGTRRLHGEFEELRARLNRRAMRPFRVLDAGARLLARLRPAGGRGSTSGVLERLGSRPLPPATDLLDRAVCPERISIILPTYDRAHVLPRAIGSVLQQSYTHWQLIVVDDGSTDSTEDLCAQYDDPRIVWVTLPHQGVSPARNAGLRLAEGEYVAFLDSDNVWYSRCLELQHAALSRADSRVVGTYCDLRWFQDEKLDKTVSPEFSQAELFHQPQVDLNSLMVRRSALDLVGGFDEQMNKWVDYELMLRLCQHGRFLHVPEVLGDYHRLPDGISRAPEAVRPFGPNLQRIRQVRQGLIRVGYVLWDYPSASQAFVHRELRALAERGIDVVVYYAEAAETRALVVPGVPAYQVRSAEELAKLATEHGRHVLHGHFAYPTSTVHLWPAAERARIPFTFTGHGVDLFHHKNEARSRVGEIGSSPYCKAAFALGEFHRRYLVERGVPAAMVRPIRCAVEPEWLEPAPDFERSLGTVVYVGRWVEKKGVLDFVEVARACEDTGLRFELYGYGPLEAEIAGAVEGVPNLTAHVGALSESEVRGVCDRASVVLLPCRRAENGDMDGLPVLLMEGAARGCLLITSDISSIPDLVRDGVSGLLVTAGDRAGYIRALRMALELPAERLASMRRAAYDTVAAEFLTHRVAEQLLETWCR